jgi:DNA polymerase (family 10)
MATNRELADLFQQTADVLELTGANRFRVVAFQKAARVVGDLTEDVAALAADPDSLTEIDGIGKGMAERIVEFVETGKVEEHQQLISDVPPGVLDLLNVPGLGPKTAAVLWKQGGVESVDDLRAKIRTGELEKLPRMGRKSLEKLAKAVDFAEAAGQRIHLGKALPIAVYIRDELAGIKGAKRVEYAGSLRRGRETIGDIDILAACDDPAAMTEAFCQLEPVDDVIASGETKSSVRLDSGVQVDLRIVPEDRFGAALAYFTGSKEHNVALRERAVKRDLRLNEYGLFRSADAEDDAFDPLGVEPVAAESEQTIYDALELAFIPPELREDRGEIRAAENGKLPELIDLGDIRCELHAHTTASDGVMSIDELAELAAERGFHTVAVTDHSVSSAIANGLDAKRLERHIEAVREADAKHEDITILAGSEVDILSDGRLDYPDSLLKQLDIVIASPHSALSQESSKATARLIKAIEHRYVHIIGHLTGRLILKREGLSPNLKKVIKAAAANDTALEINANHWRLDLRDTHAGAAIEAGVKLAVNTDAHGPADLDQLYFGVLTARRAWATKKHVVNCLPAGKLKQWLKRKR